MADIRIMRVGERETLGFDFAPDMSSNAEYFTSATATCATGLTANGSAVISGNNNTYISQAFTVGANTAGNYYAVTLNGTTDGGNKKTKVYLVRVITDVTPTGANAAYALVRLDEAMGYIGKTSDEDSWLLDQLIEGVGVEFNAYTGRNLVTATYTNEVYDSIGGTTLWLKNYPIISGLAVTEDNTTLTLGANNDYISYNDEGKLVRVDDVWYAGNQTIQVTHTSGYNATTGNITLPPAIRVAALKQIGYEFGRFKKKDWGESSHSEGDASVSTTQEGLLPDVKVVLDRYRRYTL